MASAITGSWCERSFFAFSQACDVSTSGTESHPEGRPAAFCSSAKTISWRRAPCIFAPNASYVTMMLMPPLLPSAAHATASSLSAVMTAPPIDSGTPSSGAVTRK